MGERNPNNLTNLLLHWNEIQNNRLNAKQTPFQNRFESDPFFYVQQKSN